MKKYHISKTVSVLLMAIFFSFGTVLTAQEENRNKKLENQLDDLVKFIETVQSDSIVDLSLNDGKSFSMKLPDIKLSTDRKELVALLKKRIKTRLENESFVLPLLMIQPGNRRYYSSNITYVTEFKFGNTADLRLFAMLAGGGDYSIMKSKWQFIADKNLWPLFIDITDEKANSAFYKVWEKTNKEGQYVHSQRSGHVKVPFRKFVLPYIGQKDFSKWDKDIKKKYDTYVKSIDKKFGNRNSYVQHMYGTLEPVTVLEYLRDTNVEAAVKYKEFWKKNKENIERSYIMFSLIKTVDSDILLKKAREYLLNSNSNRSISSVMLCYLANRGHSSDIKMLIERVKRKDSLSLFALGALLQCPTLEPMDFFTKICLENEKYDINYRLAAACGIAQLLGQVKDEKERKSLKCLLTEVAGEYLTNLSRASNPMREATSVNNMVRALTLVYIAKPTRKNLSKLLVFALDPSYMLSRYASCLHRTGRGYYGGSQGVVGIDVYDMLKGLKGNKGVDDDLELLRLAFFSNDDAFKLRELKKFLKEPFKEIKPTPENAEVDKEIAKNKAVEAILKKTKVKLKAEKISVKRIKEILEKHKIEVVLDKDIEAIEKDEKFREDEITLEGFLGQYLKIVLHMNYNISDGKLHIKKMDEYGRMIINRQIRLKK